MNKFASLLIWSLFICAAISASNRMAQRIQSMQTLKAKVEAVRSEKASLKAALSNPATLQKSEFERMLEQMEILVEKGKAIELEYEQMVDPRHILSEFIDDKDNAQAFALYSKQYEKYPSQMWRLLVAQGKTVLDDECRRFIIGYEAIRAGLAGVFDVTQPPTSPHLKEYDQSRIDLMRPRWEVAASSSVEAASMVEMLHVGLIDCQNNLKRRMEHIGLKWIPCDASQCTSTIRPATTTTKRSQKVQSKGWCC